MRRKVRYLLCETSADVQIGDRRSISSLCEGLLEFMGTQNYSRANPRFMHCRGTQFILRVNRGSEDGVALATAFIKSISGKPVGIRTLKTSGTILTLNQAMTGFGHEGQRTGDTGSQA